MIRISGKKLSIFLHLAAWTIIFLLPIYLFSLSSNPNVFIIVRVLSRTIVYLALFYISYFWLIPKFLFNGKRLKYYVSITITILVLYFVNETANWIYIVNAPVQDMFRGHELRKPDIRFMQRLDIFNYLFTSILTVGLSVGLRVSKKYNENEQKRKELEKEKLSSELAFLKNQISPHFFFNTLNNIYSLTGISTSQAQSAILQLSNLMRYLLYESEKGDTKLSSEIAFMKNFIELMKLRLGNNIQLSFSFPENYNDVTVPPLLFIPFVENAFKHGVGFEESEIEFKLSIVENTLIFTSKNSIVTKAGDYQDSGIGLENIKKRLAILFPGSHILRINCKDNEFDVYLSIVLN